MGCRGSGGRGGGKVSRNLLVMTLVMLVPGAAQADLAQAFNCHDEQKMFNEENCKSLLIGTIDSLYGLRLNCPDGHTSYGLAISSWRRYISKNPQELKLTTVESMQRTLNSLGLICRK